ncbi:MULTISPECIES: LysR family transcriptional regulator [unclassified Iodidimonas]|jgi:DNA-binding transcriptional LysR family regulator|uniref:LysR family transcriptional regulator n=1 Tax=unclassified Iodidimonas TaxID=2626145 RepID=UPI002482228C|nr:MULTISPECIES: LysR family transcriptional regulator [unclassified Iodidimonas]
MDQLTALRVFIKIAESGSFSKAARKLGMSKSAVSKAVSSLEDHLGARLLYRTTRQVNLTEEGRAYRDRALRIIEDLADADTAVSSLNAEPRGTLRVSSALSFGIRHIAPALPDFLLRHPDLTVDMDFNDRFVDLVEEGYDIAIRIGAMADSSLISRKIASARMVIAAGTGYLERFGTPQKPEDLAHHDCLIYRGRHSPDEWIFHDRAGTRASVKVSGPLFANNGEALKEAARHDLGIVAIPSFLLNPDLEQEGLVEILAHYSQEDLPVQAVYPPNRHLSTKVRRFIDFLADRFATAQGWSNR